MSPPVTAPRLEPRDVAALLGALRRRLADEAPGFAPREGEPADAVMTIWARMLRSLADRVDEAPDKATLAFLDMLGLDLLPSRAARAPVVFTGLPGVFDGHAPAGTRLRGAGPDGEVIFETERPVAVAGARLAEVVTVWPGRDGYADHTADALGGRPFTLWAPLAPIAHEIYLAHERHLALAGSAVIDLAITLAEPASEPMSVEWSYWDGRQWAPFLSDAEDPARYADGTDGLRRSGTIHLESDHAMATPTRVGGVDAHWLRGRLARQLAPDPGRRLPRIAAVGVATRVARGVSATAPCTGGVAPDRAYVDGAELDTSKLFFPLGPQAGPDSAFYLACEEAFSRPGANVTVCLQRAVTAQDEADAEVAKYELGVNEAQDIVDGITTSANDLIAILKGLVDGPNAPLREAQEIYDQTQVEAWYAEVRRRAQAALTAARDAAGAAQTIAATADVQLAIVAMNLVNPLGAAVAAAASLPVTAPVIALNAGTVVEAIATVAWQLSGVAADDVKVTELTALTDARDTLDSRIANNELLEIPGAIAAYSAAFAAVAGNLGNWPAGVFLPAGLPNFIVRARANITSARTTIRNAIPSAEALSGALTDLSPITLAAAANVLPPTLQDPRLVWEYWNGAAWVTRLAAAADDVRNLLASGTFTFVVPPDWEPLERNGVTARWLRARLVSGAFARVRVVTWVDGQTKDLKTMAVVEPRPPALETLRIGYDWTSPPEPLEHCLTHNDFRWADETEAAAPRGADFAPFRPTEDRTPALYLGFDAALPAGIVGVLLDLDEADTPGRGPALEWEAWDGAGWRGLRVEDETDGLVVPGIAYVPWPGVAPPPTARIAAAAGTDVVLVDPRDASRFAPGQEVYLRSGDAGELAVVAAVTPAGVTLRVPLATAFRNGSVGPAGLARFGRPRTWLRVRLREDGDPREAALRGIHANAVWAAHVQTVEREVLGASDGRAGQVLFTSRRPLLPGEEVQVRELSGARADGEYPALARELAAAGIDAARLDVEHDANGRVTGVWVPWHAPPSLQFAGPDERAYGVDRERGRILFGDGLRGRIPPPGPDAVRLRRYRTGGGVRGNVPAGAIDQVLSGVLAQAVTNPRPAEGGADAEPAAAALGRGPQTVRHRRQAVTAADYEALARECSTEVALAQARPGVAPDGREGPGLVTVMIVPAGDDPAPQPSLTLRRTVAAFLAARCPAGLAAAPAVVGPDYVSVGVGAQVAPRAGHSEQAVIAAAGDAVTRFLHPVHGGPGGRGWGDGRGVHLSDLAALLEDLPGVDAVRQIQLTRDGVAQGAAVEVAAGRLPCAGLVLVELASGVG